ncbi:hypothetical protein CW702_01700 [Candidatus Bathyarchaeota archaeon]|nr:MAG: hypothetical protein CW702_01700 [Candidatus Bathyarchaeota archaeon]
MFSPFNTRKVVVMVKVKVLAALVLIVSALGGTFYLFSYYFPRYAVPPRIVSYAPQKGAVNVELETSITITFSKPMDRESVENAFEISPKVNGEFSWDGNTLVFRPSSKLEENTTYTVTISTDARDRWGVNLKRPLEFSFATGMWLVLRVTEKTSTAIQRAMDVLASSNTVHRVVILPSGEYTFTSTVTIPSYTLVLGEGKLRDVCAIELGTDEKPPYWDPPTAHCVTTDETLIMFEVAGDNVIIKNLKIEGAVKKHERGSGTGIYVLNHRNVTIERCEILYHRMAIWFAQSQGLVRECYIHRNFRNGYGYGVCIVGTSMTTGGSNVTVIGCEFALNRHDITSNSPETEWRLIKCYFRDNDPVQNQCSVDSHAHGGRTLRFAIINCTFKNTRPIGLHSGTGVIKNNYFHSSCAKWCNEVIILGYPTHNGRYVPNPKKDAGKPKLHDIIIEGNINETGKQLLRIYEYDFPDDNEGPKPVAEKVYVDGKPIV